MADITLATLNKANTEYQPKNEIVDVSLEKKTFSVEERNRIEEVKQSIDVMDTQLVMQYGIGTQRRLTEFSDSVLKNVRSKDGGEVGNLLSDLIVEVKSLDTEKLLGSGFFEKFPVIKKSVNSLRKLKERYSKVEVQIDQIQASLEKARMDMLKDISVFDMMYQENLDCFHELEYHIIAGKEYVEEIRTTTIPKLREEAAASGNPMDAQLVNDFEDTVDAFEKKIYDLELSRTISMQSAAQIKLVQNNDRILVNKIQSAILHTISIWKNQFIIALGLSNQQRVLKQQREIADTTNKMLEANAQLLKMNTVETAKESNRGIVDVETLQKVNQDLIQTIEETMKIQQEGRAKRQAAEAELCRIEEQLKEKLLEVRGV